MSFTSPRKEHSFVVLRRRGRGAADHSKAGSHPTTAKTTPESPRGKRLPGRRDERDFRRRSSRDDGPPADRGRRRRRPADRDRAACQRLSQARQTAGAWKTTTERQPDRSGLGIANRRARCLRRSRAPPASRRWTWRFRSTSAQEAQNCRTSKSLGVPSQMTAAQRNLLSALNLRLEGLSRSPGRCATALGGQAQHASTNRRGDGDLPRLRHPSTPNAWCRSSSKPSPRWGQRPIDQSEPVPAQPRLAAAVDRAGQADGTIASGRRSAPAPTATR